MPKQTKVVQLKILSLSNQTHRAEIAFFLKTLQSLVGNPTKVRMQHWLEIPPGPGGISTHGRISTRDEELEVTLVGFPTAWLDFLPDTSVAPDVAVPIYRHF